MKSAYAAILLLILLTGCSSTPTGKEPAKLVDFKQGAIVEKRWDRNVGDVDYAGLRPAVTAEGVYAASSDGKLYKLDPVSGKKLWKIDCGFRVSGAVAAGDGLVLVGGLKSEVAAYDANGNLRWLTHVSSEVLSAPQISDGVVVVRSSDGRIAGLAAEDGKRQWLYEHSTPALTVRSFAGVLIRRGVVYAGFPGGRLAAINLASGSLLWEAAISQPKGNTELERISDITSEPVSDGVKVCAVAFQGRLACLDARQGAILWSREISSDKGLALSGNNLYVTDDEGTVLALDKSSGSTLWKNDQLFMRRVSAPLVTEKFVVVGDFEGYLHVLGRDDGSLLARKRTDGSPIRFAPAGLGKGLVLQTGDGGIYSEDIN